MKTIQDVAVVMRVRERVGIQLSDIRRSYPVNGKPIPVYYNSNGNGTHQIEVVLEGVVGIGPTGNADVGRWAVNAALQESRKRIEFLEDQVKRLQAEVEIHRYQWDGLLDLTLGQIVDRYREED